MTQLNLQRDAKVYTEDGEWGEVKHVILDHQTREVTDLVVEADGHEYLVPMSTVVDAAGDRVRIGCTPGELMARRFDHDQFDTVKEERARRESAGEATHGGAPLLDARDDAVEVGASSGTGNWDAHDAGYRLQPRTVIVTGSAPEPAFDPATTAAMASPPVEAPIDAPPDFTPAYRPDGPQPVDDPERMRSRLP